MDLKITTIFRVREHKDKTEGRGGMLLVGYFENRDDAYKAAKGKGIQGSPGDIEEFEALKLGTESYRILGARVTGFSSFKDFVFHKATSVLSDEERAELAKSN